ncbi:MAG: MBL fold metallo-hydrolase [Candidatus Helarchaeota archaeon]
MKVSFFGGVRTVGGNCVILEHALSDEEPFRIMIDFGKNFKDYDDYYEAFLRPRGIQPLRDQLALGLLPKIDGIYRKDLLGINENAEISLKEIIESHNVMVPNHAIGKEDLDLWSSSVISYEDYKKEHDGKPYLDAVLLSHAHVDHSSNIPFLDPNIPIYCSGITRAYLQVTEEISAKGIEAEITRAKIRQISTTSKSSYFPGSYTYKAPKKGELIKRKFVETTNGSEIQIEKTPFHVKVLETDHSILGSQAFLVFVNEPDRKSVFYTGDLRFHGRKEDVTENFFRDTADLSPDCLIIEGTRITSNKPDNEHIVEERCAEIIKESPGLVVIGFSWRDVNRFETILNAIRKSNSERIFVISSKLNFLLNRLKSLKIKDVQFLNEIQPGQVMPYLPRKASGFYTLGDYVYSKHDVGFDITWERGSKTREARSNTSLYYESIRAYEIARNPSKFVLFLDYYDFNELIDIFNEKLITRADSIYIGAISEYVLKENNGRLQNWLRHFKISDDLQFQVHASGHACRDDLFKIISNMKPKKVFPIHTEKPEEFEVVPHNVISNIKIGKKYEI